MCTALVGMFAVHILDNKPVYSFIFLYILCVDDASAPATAELDEKYYCAKS